ncbi:respiratory NADH dehydrogenase 2/cupric reductase [Bacteroidales bacterium]|nr:respiratory NADH dehydrogenase 2/cupric reductase [Bacteroidales bacterium]
MEKMTNIQDLPNKKRVVVIGGGFGGLKIASKLNPQYFQLVILDKNNYHQFQPLLYQVAIAGLEPSSISYPFRKNFQNKKHIQFRMCEATSVIPESKTVETTIGSITYDYLIIASGCDTNFFGNDSLKEKTIALKSVAEALYARNTILQCFEDSTTINDPIALEKLLTFIIVGGGATGVELAGALADMKKFVLPKDYPEINFDHMRIVLIDASKRLLSGMSEHASASASEVLKKRGVEIFQEVFVTSYENDIVNLNDGSTFVSKNVIWVAGVAANSLVGFQKETYGRANRIIVNEYCQIGTYKDVFALGDTAYMACKKYPNGHPQVAQVAIQMAKLVVENLEKTETNKTPNAFEYQDKGSLATIGRNAAVADLHKLHFGGRIAWLLWLFIHIFIIVGVKNKVVILLDWAWNYVTYDVSLRLLIRPKLKIPPNNIIPK